MSSGRYVMRGRVFQGRAFAAWAMANSGAAPTPVEVLTTRLMIVGTSRQRLSLTGTSVERLQMVGTSGKRLSLIGASE
jgi:hypothetical protein